jgi:hypothetical protein
MPRASRSSARTRLVRRLGILASCSAIAAAALITVSAGADADSAAPAPPLPVFSPTPTDWGPNFAFPHNLHQNQVTEADITAEREMCEWFNAQFDVLMNQINAFNGNLAANHDDYGVPGIQQQADAVTANIDQSEAFLDPRAQTFKQQSNCGFLSGDDCNDYYPLFESNDFRRIWQQQSNISTSIKNHNPSGVTNVSIGLTNLYANGIKGSGVCA